jgi:5-formyltetrahydrofolate cyclo-ligase
MAPAIEQHKREIRDRMRARRASLSRPDRDRYSELICARIVVSRAFRESRSVALFWPLLRRGEVDVRPLDAQARADQKRVHYPYWDRDDPSCEMGFRLVEDPAQLRDRGHGFFEPDPAGVVARSEDVDLVIVPALAVTSTGQRLGYGGGFYDTVLGRFCPPARSIVVAYEIQLLAELPTEPFDRACDAVVTNARVLDPGGVL